MKTETQAAAPVGQTATLAAVRLKTSQLPALFALAAGCRLRHDDDCPRCKKFEAQMKKENGRGG